MASTSNGSTSLPANLTGCIFSNEFFDALPVHRFVGRSGGVKEIYVGPNFEEIEGDSECRPSNWRCRKGKSPTSISKRDRGFDEIAGSISRGLSSGDRLWLPAQRILRTAARHADVLLAASGSRESLYPDRRTGHHRARQFFRSDRGRCGSGSRNGAVQHPEGFLVELGILDEMQDLAHAGDVDSMQRLLRNEER